MNSEITDNIRFPSPPPIGSDDALNTQDDLDTLDTRDALAFQTASDMNLVGDGQDSSTHVGAADGSGRTLRIVLYTIAIVAVVVVIYYLMVPRKLTARLARAGWFLFTSPTCGHCKRQMEVLGGSYSKMAACQGASQVSGAPAPKPCSGITAFPTWYNTKSGKTVQGMRTVSQLEEMLSTN